LIHALRIAVGGFSRGRTQNYFWRLSAIGRSSFWTSIQFTFTRHIPRSFLHMMLLMNPIVRAKKKKKKKDFAHPDFMPRAINRAAAPITFSVNDTLVEGSRSVRQRGRIGSVVLVKAIYRPFLSLCLTYAYRYASSATRRASASAKVYTRDMPIEAAYRPYYACIGTYTATSWPETRFARLIKQVIIVSAHPIFVRPCGRA